MNKQDNWLTIGVGAVLAFAVFGIVVSRHLPRQMPLVVMPVEHGSSVLDTLYPYIASPNFNSRPPGESVNCIVLHATGEDTKRGVVQTFIDPREHTSAHFVVARDGSVTQMVPVELRAWHAGASELDGVPEVNDYSIGIEMVNRDNGYESYTNAQYNSVAKLIDQIRTVYPVPSDRIVSHADIALPLGRKSDPVGFNFQRLFNKMTMFAPDIHRQMERKIAASEGQKVASTS